MHCSKSKGWDEITEDNPFTILPVPIDQRFYEHYRDPTLPYIKAGDFIFLAMAKRDRCPLISEDGKLRNRAREAGVSVFSIDEFNSAVDRGAIKIIAPPTEPAPK